MAVKQVIKKKVAMAALRGTDAQGEPSVHSIKYRKVDGAIGYKCWVCKSFRELPGTSKFRGNNDSSRETN